MAFDTVRFRRANDPALLGELLTVHPNRILGFSDLLPCTCTFACCACYQLSVRAACDDPSPQRVVQTYSNGVDVLRCLRSLERANASWKVLMSLPSTSFPQLAISTGTRQWQRVELFTLRSVPTRYNLQQLALKLASVLKSIHCQGIVTGKPSKFPSATFTTKRCFVSSRCCQCHANHHSTNSLLSLLSPREGKTCACSNFATLKNEVCFVLDDRNMFSLCTSVH